VPAHRALPDRLRVAADPQRGIDQLAVGLAHAAELGIATARQNSARQLVTGSSASAQQRAMATDLLDRLRAVREPLRRSRRAPHRRSRALGRARRDEPLCAR